MSVAALVLAAGRGERLGLRMPKAFVPLAGRPLLLHALAAMAAVPAIERVVPVIARADLERWERLAPELAAIPKLAAPAFGGAERQDSVRAGLGALGPGSEWVAVHDAATSAVILPPLLTIAPSGRPRNVPETESAPSLLMMILGLPFVILSA